MSGMDEKERSISEKINDFLRAIAQTKQQGVQCKEEVSCFLVKKKEIKEGPGKSEEKKKRAMKIKDEMKESQGLLAALEFALKRQRQE